MKILVTGSEGYIGQHLIKMLGDEHEVFGLDINDKNSPIDITKLHVGSLDCVVKYDVVIHPNEDSIRAEIEKVSKEQPHLSVLNQLTPK